MGILSFFDPVMDFIFGWLLNMSYFWAILILSFILAVLISLIYKYTTNQSLMKDLKTETKELQKEMKQLRNEPQKMMLVQKKAMETNMKYMMHSFRPMLFTFIPIIIIFGWMNMHFAYYPIMPGEQFSATVFLEEADGNMTFVAPDGIEILNGATQQLGTNNATWQLKGEEGDYMLEFRHGEKSYTKDVLITSKKAYATPIKPVKDGNVKSITISSKPVKILNLYIKGWKLGWIGTYIVFSIIFSMIIRKKLNIY